MLRKINNTVICLWMGKNLTAKTPPGDFQVTTPETPLLSQQAVTSKGIPSTLSTYSWTLTPTPNWTCSIVTVLLFNARLPSTWLTVARIPVRNFNNTNWEDCWLQSFLVYPHDKIKKMLDHKTLRCKYIATSSRERDELGQELCSQQSSQLVLLKSRTGIRATVSHVLRSRASERGTVTTEQVQLDIGVRVQL